MADISLKLEARSPLNGYSKSFGNLRVEEVTGKALVSIAVPQGGNAKLATAIKKQLGAAWPEIGTTTTSPKGYQLLGIQADMVLAVFDHPGGLSDDVIRKGLGDKAYCTDQSDAWVMIRVAGEGVYEALERICPLDISERNFAIGQVARTQMEHLGAIIVKEDKNEFLLMSASSSADDFLHAITVSVENIL